MMSWTERDEKKWDAPTLELLKKSELADVIDMDALTLRVNNDELFETDHRGEMYLDAEIFTGLRAYLMHIALSPYKPAISGQPRTVAEGVFQENANYLKAGLTHAIGRLWMQALKPRINDTGLNALQHADRKVDQMIFVENHVNTRSVEAFSESDHPMDQLFLANEAAATSQKVADLLIQAADKRASLSRG